MRPVKPFASCSLHSETCPPHPKNCFWRLRAAIAPASTGPSRRSSARSSSTARPSTCARRSSTTSTWSSGCASAARSSSTTRPRCRRARRSCSPRTASRPRVHANAAERSLQTIDATCPLVTKVHVEAKKFAADGYTIVLVGHEGHEEVEGTMGEAPDSIVLIETEADVDALEVEDPDRVAFISQTTLSVDETAAIINRLREKFPNITGPRTDDICYATTNRQMAVRQMARRVRPRAGDRLAQLVELEPARRGRARPRRRLLPDRQRDPGAGGVARGQARGRHQLRRERPGGARPAPGRVRSASAAPTDVSEFEVVQEDVRFMLPKEIRKALGGARAAGRRLAGGRGVNWKPCSRSPGAPAATVPSVS